MKKSNKKENKKQKEKKNKKGWMKKNAISRVGVGKKVEMKKFI